MPKKFMYLNKLKNIPGPRLVISMAGGGFKGWDAGTRASYQNPLWSAVCMVQLIPGNVNKHNENTSYKIKRVALGSSKNPLI